MTNDAQSEASRGELARRWSHFRSSWSALRALHLVAGVGAYYAFGRSGQYMDTVLDHLVGMDDAPRALYRSGHIYLLFVALIHVLLGVYLRPSPAFLGRVAQWLGSLMLFFAIWLFISGFYEETPLGLVERPNVRQGIVMSLVAVSVHGGAVLLLWWLPESIGRMIPRSLRRLLDRGGGTT